MENTPLVDIGNLCKQGLKVREFVLIYFSNVNKIKGTTNA